MAYDLRMITLGAAANGRACVLIRLDSDVPVLPSHESLPSDHELVHSQVWTNYWEQVTVCQRRAAASSLLQNVRLEKRKQACANIGLLRRRWTRASTSSCTRSGRRGWRPSCSARARRCPRASRAWPSSWARALRHADLSRDGRACECVHCRVLQRRDTSHALRYGSCVWRARAHVVVHNRYPRVAVTASVQPEMSLVCVYPRGLLLACGRSSGGMARVLQACPGA